MICFDPGLQTGWATFDDELADGAGVRLLSCGLVNAAPGWTFPHVLSYHGRAIIEMPQIYPRMKGDPNDLIRVAIIAGQISQTRHSTEFVLPREWKGTLDGDLMHVRIIEALTPDERFIYFAATDGLPEGVRHNVADAIGIGLWKLGRLSARRLTTRRKQAIKKTRSR